VAVEHRRQQARAVRESPAFRIAATEQWHRRQPGGRAEQITPVEVGSHLPIVTGPAVACLSAARQGSTAAGCSRPPCSYVKGQDACLTYLTSLFWMTKPTMMPTVST
jgi:hypothetical protein